MALQAKPSSTPLLQASGAPARPTYRRSSTCRAPRKRTALVTTSKLSASAAAGGNGGPCGPNGPDGRPPRGNGGNGDFWCRGSGGSGGDDGRQPGASPLGIALAAAGVAAVSQARPALAVHGGRGDGSDSDAYDAAGGEAPEVVFVPDELATDAWLFSATGGGDASCSSALTADELELLEPRQYRVREWVLV